MREWECEESKREEGDRESVGASKRRRMKERRKDRKRVKSTKM